MTGQSKICASACVLGTYFVNDIFVALTNQILCFEFCFVLFRFTSTIILVVAFIVVIIIYQ